MHGAHSGRTDAPPPIMPWAVTTVTAAITVAATRAAKGRTVAATVGWWRRWRRNFPRCLSLLSLAEQVVLPCPGSPAGPHWQLGSN